VTTVHLQLNLERDDYARYDVSLETPEGGRVWHAVGAPSVSTAPGNPAVTIVLPATLLRAGDYLIRLAGSGVRGTGQVAEVYSLRVVQP
jgi:hypothetical protein